MIRQLVSEKQETETKGERTYTISGRNDHLDLIEQLFRWMNMTAGGHSGTAQISIDGDGAARIHVERKDGELCQPPEEFKPGSGKEPEFKVGLD